MSHEIIHSLFNTYTEVHAAQLGVLLGLFVGLSYRDQSRLAYLLLFSGVVLAFGNATVIGFGDIAKKPWYFLGAAYLASVASMLGVYFIDTYLRQSVPSPQSPSD